MREILFRGKRLDNGVWITGAYHEAGGRHFILPFPIVPPRIKVDPATVGQFTGLLDKHGKRIFEGDVFDWGYAGVYDMRYVVSYDDETASFIGVRKGGFLSLSGIEIEVIGNIHDNPKLLKEGEDDG